MSPYIVCSTPRSGTNFLKHILMSHGLGFPSEHSPKVHPIETERDIYVTTYHSYETQVWSRTLFYTHLRELIDTYRELKGLPKDIRDIDVVTETHPGIKFIYLYRRNTLRQSISYVKAKKSGVWELRGNAEPPNFENYVYDRAEIDEMIKTLNRENKGWCKWFKDNEIELLGLMYEECVRFPLNTLKRCVDFLEVDVAISQERLDIAMQSPLFPKKQSDETTCMWLKKYSEGV